MRYALSIVFGLGLAGCVEWAVLGGTFVDALGGFTLGAGCGLGLLVLTVAWR